MVCVFQGPTFALFLSANLSDSLLSCVLYCGGSEAPLLYLKHGWDVSSLSLHEEDVTKFVCRQAWPEKTLAAGWLGALAL